MEESVLAVNEAIAFEFVKIRELSASPPWPSTSLPKTRVERGAKRRC
jgi:hypothetical protein